LRLSNSREVTRHGIRSLNILDEENDIVGNEDEEEVDDISDV